MKFHAYDSDGNSIYSRTYYSVGGGFVVNETAAGEDRIVADRHGIAVPVSRPEWNCWRTAKSRACPSARSCCRTSAPGAARPISAQACCISGRSCRHAWSAAARTEGVLPGGLKVKRRAARLHRQLIGEKELHRVPLGTMDWVNLFALAVNEENAAGGRVVTAPTNGAAGIVPAVMHYFWKFCSGYSEDAIVRFLLTAGAIGILYKENASISGAEVGCQGEVGSACSMAAGALTEVTGGTPQQVENAAEIAMEHNLGLTCDPVGGLVQVPCIERNAMGAVKAINASRMALRGDGTHFVSLDKVIKTMRETGADMKTKYKETARGGLAVNVIEC